MMQRMVDFTLVREGEPIARAEAPAVPPVCRCGGAGHFVWQRSDGAFELLPCVCKAEEIERRRARKLQEASGLGALKEKTFETFDASVPGLARAYEKAREFVEDPDGWLLLSGPWGTGKTHLAAAIAHEVIKKGSPAIFLNVPDFLDHLRQTYHPDSPVTYDETFTAARQVRVLVLDDLGAHKSSEWAKEKLYQLVNHRYNYQLPTVITANGLDGVDGRLASRILDKWLTTVVNIQAKDYRTQ